MNIKPGQLVRIVTFGKRDAFHRTPMASRLIGLTGRFMDGVDFVVSSDNSVQGDFFYEPDTLNHNVARPYFVQVFVEPVEEEHESKTAD